MKNWYQSKTIMLQLLSVLIATMGIINEEILKAVGITDTGKFLIVIGFLNALFTILIRTFSTSTQIKK